MIQASEQHCGFRRLKCILTVVLSYIHILQVFRLLICVDEEAKRQILNVDWKTKDFGKITRYLTDIISFFKLGRQ